MYLRYPRDRRAVISDSMCLSIKHSSILRIPALFISVRVDQFIVVHTMLVKGREPRCLQDRVAAIVEVITRPRKRPLYSLVPSRIGDYLRRVEVRVWGGCSQGNGGVWAAAGYNETQNGALLGYTQELVSIKSMLGTTSQGMAVLRTRNCSSRVSAFYRAAT